MNINYQLASEIYGKMPWHVDANSLGVLTSILNDARNGVSLAIGETKNNTPHLAFMSDSRLVTQIYDLDNKEQFDAVGVININGPITNSGGASSYGMLELSSMMRKMNADSRIKGFIVLGNSGGGSSIAVETMTRAIDEVRASGKEVIGVIEEGGMACSAMYMILAACNAIYAQSEMSFVGSNGTMIQFQGIPANSEIDGVKYISLYATKSTKKNEAFNEAINNNNYQLTIDDLLDPVNERALSKVIAYRPQLASTDFATGIDIFAKDGVGTYIDGFKTFEEVYHEILLNNTKTINMTLEQLKSEHPSIYSEAVTAGVNQERDRVGSWLAHHNTDSQTVIDGIKSGEVISSTVREELLVKANSTNRLTELENRSPQGVAQPQSETPTVVEKTAEEKEVEQSEAAFKAAFGLK